MLGLFSKKWSPKGKHVYVTGGSTGLGLALAEILVKQGADVSIVARDQGKLDDAVKVLEASRQTEDQNIRTYSFALETASAATEALEAVCAPYGGEAPDAVMACAGAARPKFFVEMTEEDLVKGMNEAYWVQAWTAWAVTKKLVKQQKKHTKIVLVGSLVSYFSFIGYASYAPGKHALLGLAETLRSELKLYETDIHFFTPPTMVTPGYEVENTTKPAVTKTIEEGDDGLSPAKAAQAIIYGVQHGHVHIAGDTISKLLRASTRGSTPRSNPVTDFFLDIGAWIIMPFWRSSADKLVVKHRQEHQAYLSERGFFKS